MRKASLVVLVTLLIVLMVVPLSLEARGSREKKKETAPTKEEVAKEEQVYYMVPFLSGIEWWIAPYNGMKAAAHLLGVKALYQGTEEYDAIKQVQVFEQVVAMKPTGILASPMNPDPFLKPINDAIDAGIAVVCFAADSPKSNRPTLLTCEDYNVGVRAGNLMAEICNKKGKVLISTTIGQTNMMNRANGFKDTIVANYPQMKVLPFVEEGGNYETEAKNVAPVLQAHPDLAGIYSVGSMGPGAVQAVKEAGLSGKVKIIGMGLDDRLMELIESGDIVAAFTLGEWNMGFWSMVMCYYWANGLVEPITNWKEAGVSPLPPYVDTGSDMVTKDNVQFFKDYNKPVNY